MSAHRMENISVYLNLCSSIEEYVYLPMCLPITRITRIHVSVCLTMWCLPITLWICLTICKSITRGLVWLHMSILHLWDMSACLFICKSAHHKEDIIFAYLFVCLFVFLFVCSLIHPCISVNHLITQPSINQLIQLHSRMPILSSIHPWINLPVTPRINNSIYQTINAFITPCTHSFIYPAINVHINQTIGLSIRRNIFFLIPCQIEQCPPHYDAHMPHFCDTLSSISVITINFIIIQHTPQIQFSHNHQIYIVTSSPLLSLSSSISSPSLYLKMTLLNHLLIN